MSLLFKPIITSTQRQVLFRLQVGSASMERPTGLLQFYHEGSTGAIEKAIAEIKQMNKEAGYV